MADVVGLAASIIQIAGAGTKLSLALYNFTTSAVRADQDVKDIADDVELTSNALESVGRVFEMEDAKSVISKKAIQDANNIIKKCESVFNEISEMIEKRRKPGKDGKKSLSLMGKLSFPMREQRIELNRRRLESLKNSLILLLHVLQLAQGQARGKMEKSVMEEEREKIRELHQRQQDSLKSLQALESKFCKVTLDDEETLQGSVAASRAPTLDFMANAHPSSMPPLEKTDSLATLNTLTIDLSAVDDSETSESDATITDDEDEHLSLEELSQCAKQVQKLLKRITMLQQNFESCQKTVKHRKKRVHKMYRRFCRKFESNIDIAPTPHATHLDLFSDSNCGGRPYNPKPTILDDNYRRKTTHGGRFNDVEHGFRQPHGMRAVPNDIHQANVSNDPLSHSKPPISLELNDWSARFPSLSSAAKALPDAEAMSPPKINLDFAPPSRSLSLKVPDVKFDTGGLTPPRPSDLQSRRRAKSDVPIEKKPSPTFISIHAPPSKTEHLPSSVPWDTAPGENWNLSEDDTLESFDFDSFLHTDGDTPFKFKSTSSQSPNPSLHEMLRFPPTKRKVRPTQGDRVYMREMIPNQPEITQQRSETHLEELSVSHQEKVGKVPTAPTATGPPVRFIDAQFSRSSSYSAPMPSPEDSNDHALRRIRSGGIGNSARIQKAQPTTAQQQHQLQQHQLQQHQLQQHQQIHHQQIHHQQIHHQQQQQMQQQQMQQSTPTSQTAIATPRMALTSAQQQPSSATNTQNLQVLAVQQMRRHIDQHGIPEGQNALDYQQRLLKALFAKLKLEADRSRLQADPVTVAQSSPQVLPSTQAPQAGLLPYPIQQRHFEAPGVPMNEWNMPKHSMFSLPGSASMISPNNSFSNTDSHYQIPAQPRFTFDPATQGNHALQDYQMQLMLLEQQNKKRLLMARQEHNASASDDRRATSPAGHRSGQSPVPAKQMKRSGTPHDSMNHDIGDKRESEMYSAAGPIESDPKQYFQDFTNGSDTLLKPEGALHSHTLLGLDPSDLNHPKHDGSDIPIDIPQPRQVYAFQSADSIHSVSSDASSDDFYKDTISSTQHAETKRIKESFRGLYQKRFKEVFGEELEKEDKDIVPQKEQAMTTYPPKIGDSVDEKSNKVEDKRPEVAKSERERPESTRTPWLQPQSSPYSYIDKKSSAPALNTSFSPILQDYRPSGSHFNEVFDGSEMREPSHSSLESESVPPTHNTAPDIYSPLSSPPTDIKPMTLQSSLDLIEIRPYGYTVRPQKRLRESEAAGEKDRSDTAVHHQPKKVRPEAEQDTQSVEKKRKMTHEEKVAYKTARRRANRRLRDGDEEPDMYDTDGSGKKKRAGPKPLSQEHDAVEDEVIGPGWTEGFIDFAAPGLYGKGEEQPWFDLFPAEISQAELIAMEKTKEVQHGEGNKKRDGDEKKSRVYNMDNSRIAGDEAEKTTSPPSPSRRIEAEGEDEVEGDERTRPQAALRVAQENEEEEPWRTIGLREHLASYNSPTGSILTKEGKGSEENTWPVTHHSAIQRLREPPRPTIPSEFEITSADTPSDVPPDTRFTNLTSVDNLSPDNFLPTFDIELLEPEARQKRPRESNEKGGSGGSDYRWFDAGNVSEAAASAQQEGQEQKNKRSKKSKKSKKRTKSERHTPPPYNDFSFLVPATAQGNFGNATGEAMTRVRKGVSGDHRASADEKMEKVETQTTAKTESGMLEPPPVDGMRGLSHSSPFLDVLPGWEKRRGSDGREYYCDNDSGAKVYCASEAVAPTLVKQKPEQKQGQKDKKVNKRIGRQRLARLPSSTPFVVATAPEDFKSGAMEPITRVGSNLLYNHWDRSAREEAERVEQKKMTLVSVETEMEMEEGERDIVDILLEQWTVPVA